MKLSIWALLIPAWLGVEAIKMSVTAPSGVYNLQYAGIPGEGRVPIVVNIELEGVEEESILSEKIKQSKICARMEFNIDELKKSILEPVGEARADVLCVDLSSNDFKFENVKTGDYILGVMIVFKGDKYKQLSNGFSVVRFTAEPPTLLDLGLKVSSDKVKHHGYHRFYENALAPFTKHRESQLKLLEIGMLGGGSYDLWRAYLPNAYFIGMDNGYQSKLPESCPNPMIDTNPMDNCVRLLRNDTNAGKDMIYYGDQANETFLKMVVEREKKFDIIIDDGGHSHNQQLTSFRVLFPALKEDGLYVIEDIETSYWHLDSDYSRGGRNIPDTPVNIFKRIADVINKEFHDTGAPYYQAGENDELGGYDVEKWIKSITFGQNWIGITKKTENDLRLFDSRAYRFKHKWVQNGLEKERDPIENVCKQSELAKAAFNKHKDELSIQLHEELCQLQNQCDRVLKHTWIGNGIGSAMHFLAISFTAAHADGRALVPGDPLDTESGIKAYFGGTHNGLSCESFSKDEKMQNSIECFLRPFTTCSAEDADLRSKEEENQDGSLIDTCDSCLDKLNIYDTVLNEHPGKRLNGSIKVWDYSVYEKAQADYMKKTGIGAWSLQWWVPEKYRHKGPLWYRSHVLNFFLQPSRMMAQAVLDAKRELGITTLEEQNIPILAMHVRRGDKLTDVGMEDMVVPDLHSYIEAAREIKRIHRPDLHKILISTEDQSVLETITKEYGNEFQFIYTNDHKRHQPGLKKSIGEMAASGEGVNNGFTESMIAWRNLFMASDCQFFVGTLSSNWGRLILELMYAKQGHMPVHVSLDQGWIA